jgi:DnaK suppressor protein
MTRTQRDALSKRLRSLRAELVGKGPAAIDPNRASAVEAGTDDDAQPLNEMLQAIASSRNRNHDAVVARIDRALAKLAGDPEDLGVCEDCVEEIPLGRLKAMPYAELCVVCQSKRDAPKGGPTRRKITDYV